MASRRQRSPTSSSARPRATVGSASETDLPAAGRHGDGGKDGPGSAARPKLFDLGLIWVTGKGGVGKTTIAAAIADVAARHGRRTLVCEMDAKGALAGAFDVGPLEFAPRRVMPNLWAMTMNTEDSLREYLRLFVPIPLLGRIGPLATTFDFVADAAPGVKEILGVGKLCYEVRERHYDLVVVDGEATGHIVSQIGAPRVIADLVHVGLVRDQTQWMLDILDDPTRTGVAVVTTPEEMPVTETIELLARLRAETGVDVNTVIANRVLPATFNRREQDVVDRLDDALDLLVDVAGPAVEWVVDAARFTEHRRANGARHLDRLRAMLADTDSAVAGTAERSRSAGGNGDTWSTGAPGTSPPVVTVPELYTRAAGPRVVSLVADALTHELEPTSRPSSVVTPPRPSGERHG